MNLKKSLFIIMPTKYSKKRNMRSVRKYSKKRKYSKRKNNKKRGGMERQLFAPFHPPPSYLTKVWNARPKIHINQESTVNKTPIWYESDNWKNILVKSSTKTSDDVLYFNYEIPKQGIKRIPIIIAVKGTDLFKYSLEKDPAFYINYEYNDDHDLLLKRKNSLFKKDNHGLIKYVKNFDSNEKKDELINVILKYEKSIRSQYGVSKNLEQNEIKILISDIIIPILNKKHSANFKLIAPYDLNSV